MFDVFLFYSAFAILGFGVIKNKKLGALLSFVGYVLYKNSSLRLACKTFLSVSQGAPGGSVVQNPPTSAGGRGSIPGPERSHVQQSSCTTTIEPAL